MFLIFKFQKNFPNYTLLLHQSKENNFQNTFAAWLLNCSVKLQLQKSRNELLYVSWSKFKTLNILR